jgi:3-oxoacyl-[acyl-carrier-protein] synthase III
MKIVGIEHSIPGTAYSNERVIEKVTSASRDTLSEHELKHTARYLGDLFDIYGLKNRFLSDGRERPIDLAVGTANRALAAVGIEAGELDFIIYGGVARGFLVPSTASAVQHALGASGVTCFDVLDACASWLRAMQVAQGLISTGAGKLGLVVNCECGMHDDPRVWEIRSVDDLERLGGTFTIGEAATATVVAKPDNGEQVKFYSHSFGEFGDLAVIPLRDIRRYSQLAVAPLECMLFHTRAHELMTQGFRVWMDCVRAENPQNGQVVDVLVPHAGAARMIDVVLRAGKTPARRIIRTFADYGNTVAASIPLGLSIAAKDGRLNRGDHVHVGSVAAGISVVGAQFVY